MEQVLHLARMMAEMRLAEYEGARIAKISWRKEPRPGMGYGVRFQKHGTRFLRIVCCETKQPLMGEISASLMLGKGGVGKSQSVPKEERILKQTGTTWRCFSYAEVLAFVAAAGDANSIHRQEPAIVPGMLILQELLGEHPMAQRMEIRFFSRFIVRRWFIFCLIRRDIRRWRRANGNSSIASRKGNVPIRNIRDIIEGRVSDCKERGKRIEV